MAIMHDSKMFLTNRFYNVHCILLDEYVHYSSCIVNNYIGSNRQQASSRRVKIYMQRVLLSEIIILQCVFAQQMDFDQRHAIIFLQMCGAIGVEWYHQLLTRSQKKLQ